MPEALLRRSVPDSIPTGPPSSVLEEFVSVIAHELQTPLSIVYSASEVVLDHGEGCSPQLLELLEVIRRNALLASLMLRRLSVARDIEAGTVELVLERIDLGELVRESVSDLEHVFLRGHPIEVTVVESPLVPADPTAAREIVFNLLSNAAKYSDASAPIDVTIGTTDRMLRVVVRDHGPGVTPGHVSDIFEKYWQHDEGSPGAGLGLFISRGLARSHHGDITVQAAADGGSEFCLTLPLESREEAAAVA